ncbi:MAG TPA: methyltransferase [Dongiaceae bacterium]|nr:methyltransferase [Dongiaceae bacterium]
MAADQATEAAGPTPPSAQLATMSDLPITTDAFLGGRLTLRQPRDGYRAAIDPVLLAAAVTAPEEARLVDLGCGVGTAGLCVLARLPGISCTGIDIQAPLVALAQANAGANGLGERYQARCGSIGAKDVLRDLGTVDQVIANPPYLAQGEASASAHPIKALANMESDAPLSDWIIAATRIVRPGGTVTFIHRAERLPELLALMRENLGSLAILPVQPKADSDAHRVIVRGRKGKRAPARLLAPLILHETDGSYTTAAQRLLRDAGRLDL